MSEVSVGEALGSGFGLVRRKPLSFLVWTLAYIVLGILPAVLIFSLAGPSYIELFRAAAGGDTLNPPGAAELQAFTAQMQGVQAVNTLVGIVMASVLYSAIMRAVLEPEKKAFGYLRLGMDEVRQAVMWVGFYIFGFVALMIVILAYALLIGVTSAVSVAAGVIVSIVVGFAVLAGVVWLGARLSMVLPMTFADKKFRFAAAWKLTKGNGRRLSLLLLGVVLIAFVAVVIMLAVVGATIAAFVASRPEAATLSTFFSQPTQALIRELSPWVIVLSLAGTLFYTLLAVIMTAPWAVAYRQLAGDRQNTADVFA